MSESTSKAIDLKAKEPLTRLRMVISGGQTGADIGGLVAAEACMIQTGGMAPLGYRTENGRQPILRFRFGLTESDSCDYPKRTLANVIDSDVTLIFSSNPSSGGTRQTITMCSNASKPYLLINPAAAGALHDVVYFLRMAAPAVLNVAGNRESVSPGISRKVVRLLKDAFTMLFAHDAGHRINGPAATIEVCDRPDADMFDDPSYCLVNPVNAGGDRRDGVMGAGLATQFANLFPELVSLYRSDCSSGRLVAGDATLYPIGAGIACVATKHHFRDASKIEWIASGAQALRRLVIANNIERLAIPALGCGKGMLPWGDVLPILHSTFSTTRSLQVRLYPPKPDRGGHQ